MTRRPAATRASDAGRVRGFMVRCMSSAFSRRGRERRCKSPTKNIARSPQTGHSPSGGVHVPAH